MIFRKSLWYKKNTSIVTGRAISIPFDAHISSIHFFAFLNQYAHFLSFPSAIISSLFRSLFLKFCLQVSPILLSKFSRNITFVTFLSSYGVGFLLGSVVSSSIRGKSKPSQLVICVRVVSHSFRYFMFSNIKFLLNWGWMHIQHWSICI